MTQADSPRQKLIDLANELDAELDSGATWTKAQHTCCSVSSALRAMAAATANQPQQVRELLKGIDKQEVDDPDGWWETSTGAEFGAEKLKQLLELLGADPGVICPDCHGSGEGIGMAGRGPDTYETIIVCPKCCGCGEVPR